MDIRKVKKLIEMLEESQLNEIEIKEGEESVKLVKSGSIATQTMVPQIPVEKSMETSSENQQKDDIKNDLPADSPKVAAGKEIKSPIDFYYNLSAADVNAINPKQFSLNYPKMNLVIDMSYFVMCFIALIAYFFLPDTVSGKLFIKFRLKKYMV